MVDIKATLRQLNGLLKKLKDKKIINNYALIGALATSARGKPRATRDIDFLVSTESVDQFYKEVASLPEFIAEQKKGDITDPIYLLVRLYDKDKVVIADFIISHLKWEEDIINNATGIKLEGKEEKEVPIPLAEDLIVLKVRAGSPQDLLDAKELLRVAVKRPQGLNYDRMLDLAKRARVDKNLRRLLGKLKLADD